MEVSIELIHLQKQGVDAGVTVTPNVKVFKTLATVG